MGPLGRATERPTDAVVGVQAVELDAPVPMDAAAPRRSGGAEAHGATRRSTHPSRSGGRPAVPGQRGALATDRRARRPRVEPVDHHDRRPIADRDPVVPVQPATCVRRTRHASGYLDVGRPRRRDLRRVLRDPTRGARSSSEGARVSDVTVRLARAGDWPAVAGLLVELGRGVAVGTADDATHRLQFAGHHPPDRARDAGRGGRRRDRRRDRHGVPPAPRRPPAAGTGARSGGDGVGGERGVGTALLRHAEELARRRGCFRMALVTAARRKKPWPSTNDEGWQDYGTWFVKPLTDDVAASGEPVRDDPRKVAEPRGTAHPNRCSAMWIASSAAPIRRLSAQLNNRSASSRPGT